MPVRPAEPKTEERVVSDPLHAPERSGALRSNWWRPLRRAVRAAKGIVQLLRPLNGLLFAVGVLVGGVLGGEEVVLRGALLPRLLLAALSAVCIGTAANALNDVFDLAIDRVNRPARPLPAGRVSVGAARAVWGVGTLAGVGLAALLSATHFALAIGVAGLLLAYNAWLKRTVLLGNIAVGIAVAVALPYGAAAVGHPADALIGAVFALLTTLAREIVKDVEDLAGDVQAGVRTLPVVFGTRLALDAAAALAVLTVSLSPVPFLWFGYNGLYLLVVLLADLVLLRVIRLLVRAEAADVARASRALKIAMVGGLAALLLSGFPE